MPGGAQGAGMTARDYLLLCHFIPRSLNSFPSHFHTQPPLSQSIILQKAPDISSRRTYLLIHTTTTPLTYTHHTLAKMSGPMYVTSSSSPLSAPLSHFVILNFFCCRSHSVSDNDARDNSCILSYGECRLHFSPITHERVKTMLTLCFC